MEKKMQAARIFRVNGLGSGVLSNLFTNGDNYGYYMVYRDY